MTLSDRFKCPQRLRLIAALPGVYRAYRAAELSRLRGLRTCLTMAVTGRWEHHNQAGHMRAVLLYLAARHPEATE